MMERPASEVPWLTTPQMVEVDRVRTILPSLQHDRPYAAPAAVRAAAE